MNCVRMEQKKGDKSAEKKLLVCLQLQEGRAPESTMSREVILYSAECQGEAGVRTPLGLTVCEQKNNEQSNKIEDHIIMGYV